MLWDIIKAIAPSIGNAIMKAITKEEPKVWTDEIVIGNMLGPRRDAEIQSHAGEYLTLKTEYYPDAGLIDHLQKMGYYRTHTNKTTWRKADGKLTNTYYSNFKLRYVPDVIENQLP